jgi:hypothetical protein
LNNRRKAKKPVMPMPKRASEVGSGMVGARGVTEALTVPVSPEGTPDSDALNIVGVVADVKVHSRVDVVAVAAVKVTSTVFAGVSEIESPERPPVFPAVIASPEMGSTDGA